ASGLAWAAIGLFFSALFRRTIVAVIASYFTASAWVILTILARPLRAALLNAQAQGASGGPPVQPVGPYLVELMNPLLVLLRTLGSPVANFIDWMTMVGHMSGPGTKLTLGARVAAALGPYLAYVLSALALTLVLSALTARIIARRRV
ncbi:MAG TPA: ABC transporter, partial [Thermaerobacter sp.]